MKVKAIFFLILALTFVGVSLQCNDTTPTNTTTTTTTTTPTTTTTAPTATPTPITNTVPVASIFECLKNKPMVTYVDALSVWWPAEGMAKAMGVPGYADENPYNVFIYSFWMTNTVADTASVYSSITTFFGTDNSQFGKTKTEIQATIRNAFNKAGQKLLVSAFGSSDIPTTSGKDPIMVAQRLAQFVKENGFDGVDLDWEDSGAMERGTGEAWLITLTKELRRYLPQGEYILTHAPQAPYFTGTIRYPKGGYLTVDKEVGNLIDWYNIQFYNQNDCSYDSYEKLFLKNNDCWFPQTTIDDIVNQGINPNKIVIGKPAQKADAQNTGLVIAKDLGNWGQAYFQKQNLCFGVMTWQYVNDPSGAFVKDYNAGLLDPFYVPPAETTTTGTGSTTTTTAVTPTIVPVAKLYNPSPNQCFNNIYMVTYVNVIDEWWPPENIAKHLGTPGLAADSPYNVFLWAFWLSTGPVDVPLVFSNAELYFGTQSSLGKTKEEIQVNIVNAFHKAGKQVLISAFGATEFPTTEGRDAIKVARDLAKFCIDNKFDGVDIDWEDNGALEIGTGEQWLIDFTKELRVYLPVGQYILTHAPQAPYFTGTQKYPKGGYNTIHKEVGHLIDWYNIQFYNQGDNAYDSYSSLFTNSAGWFPRTSVDEIMKQGVEAHKIVIGKPASQKDVMNSGLVNSLDMGQWAKQYYNQVNPTCFGVMTWQYSNDLSGQYIYGYLKAF